MEGVIPIPNLTKEVKRAMSGRKFISFLFLIFVIAILNCNHTTNNGMEKKTSLPDPSNNFKPPSIPSDDKFNPPKEFSYFIGNLSTLLLHNFSFPSSSEAKFENFFRKYNKDGSFQDFVSFTVIDSCGRDINVNAVLKNTNRFADFSLSWDSSGKRYIANGSMLYIAYYPTDNTTFPLLPTYVEAELRNFLVYIHSDLSYNAISVNPHQPVGIPSPFRISISIETSESGDIKGKILIGGAKVVSGDRNTGCSYFDGVKIMVNLLWKNFEFGRTFFPEDISIGIEMNNRTEIISGFSAKDECSNESESKCRGFFLCGFEDVRGQKFPPKYICPDENCDGSGGCRNYWLECVEEKIYREGVTYAFVFDEEGREMVPPLFPVKYTISYLQVKDECKNMKTDLGDEILLSLYIDSFCLSACEIVNLFDEIIVNEEKGKILAIIRPKKSKCSFDKDYICPAYIECLPYGESILLPKKFSNYDILFEIHADRYRLNYW